MGGFDLSKCVRPNIFKLEPYRCARDDYKDDGTNVLLDANENAYGPGISLDSSADSSDSFTSKAINTESIAIVSKGIPQLDFHRLNRYPDPHQIELKQLFCDLRNTGAHSSTPLSPDNMFVGVGSDEAIDAILRVFCAPGRDKLLICPPTYGMYSVSACVNDVDIIKVPLNTHPSSSTSEYGDTFSLCPDTINEVLSADPSIKAVYVCSPGNPTGNLLRKEDVRQILEHPTWNGVVVVDEAYIDFAENPETSSLATWVPEWPNLIVMQTLSKGFGLAGARVGVIFADLNIARILNSLKAPYNVSSPSSALATYALRGDSLTVMRGYRKKIIAQRERLVKELPHLDGIGRIRGGRDANFLLVEIVNAKTSKPSNEIALAVYEQMAQSRGVVVRFRGKEHGCLGCLRITIGTEKEVDKLLADIRTVLDDITGGKGSIHLQNGSQEEKKEQRANNVLA